MTLNKNKNINKKWYPKPLSVTLLSVLLGILTGITINLLTDSLPTNSYLLVLKIGSIGLFILSSITLWILLSIRIEIDEDFSKRIYDNREYGINPNDIWKATLNEKIDKQKKFNCWKWIGIVTLIMGVMLVIVANIENRSDDIINENKMYDNYTTLVDSFGKLNRRVEKQNVLILQHRDSLQSINNQIRNSNDLRDGLKKTKN